MNRKLFKSTVLLIFISILMVFVVWNIDVVRDGLGKLLHVLRPVFIGLAIALVLNNPMAKLNQLFGKLFAKKKREHTKLCGILSLISVYIIFFGFIAVVIFVIVPELFSSISKLSTNIDAYYANFTNWLENLYNKIDAQFSSDFKLFDELYEVAKNLLANVDTLFKGVLGVTSNVVTIAIDILIGIIVSVYLLAGKKKMYGQFKKLCFAFFKNENALKVCRGVEIVNRTFANFIAGQLTEAVILSLMCYTGMTIFGFDFAVLISFIIGLTSLIPIVGAFIGTIPAAFLLLLISPIKALWFVLFIIVLQQIEGNLIYPRVVGNKVGLSPIWVLVAIIIGGGLWGILGMLICVPIMSIIYECVSGFVNEKIIAKKLSGEISDKEL